MCTGTPGLKAIYHLASTRELTNIEQPNELIHAIPWYYELVCFKVL